jgi:hypothetical protein
MAQTTQFATRKLPPGGRVDTDYISGSKPPKTPYFGTRMPNFQPNKYTRITFEQHEIDKKFQRTSHIKLGSDNRMVTFLLKDIGHHLTAKTTSGSF